MAQRIFRVDGKSPTLNADLYFETSLGDKYVVCLSPRDVFIIRSYLFPYAQWRTRLARPVYGDYWQLSTDGEYVQLLDDLEALDAKITENRMSCIDDGLTRVANAITLVAQKMCCNQGQDNGGVVGTVNGESGTIPIYGSTPLKEVTEGVPPDGWDTWEEYQLNKCQVANGVFDGIMDALGNLSTITFVSVTSLGTLIGLAFPAIIPFPPAAIPVMIGLMIALAGFYVAFGQIKEQLEANRESIVCGFYQSNTVESMTAIFADALDAAIALIGVSSAIGALLKSAALLLVNGDTLNQLQSGIAGYAYPDADCSGCGVGFVARQQTVYEQSYGSFASIDYQYGDTLNLSSYTFNSGSSLEPFDYVVVEFGQRVNIAVDTNNWSPPGEGWGSASYFRAGSSFGDNYGGESDVYNDNDPPINLSGVGNITFASSSGDGFSVMVTITEYTP